MKKFVLTLSLASLTLGLSACGGRKDDMTQGRLETAPEVIQLTCNQKLVSFDTGDHGDVQIEANRKILTRNMRKDESPETYSYRADRGYSSGRYFIKLVESFCPDKPLGHRAQPDQ